MTSARNPIKDRVAISNVATTGFVPRNSDRSPMSLALEACTTVLRESGLSPAEVDGMCGSIPSAPDIQAALGIPNVRWFANPVIPFGNHLIAAVAAVHSGMADVVLAYHTSYRMAWNTRSALKDPFRRSLTPGAGPSGGPGPETIAAAVGYAAWASRYKHEYGASREPFGSRRAQ